MKQISECAAIEYGDSDRLLILFSSKPAMRRDVFDYATFVQNMPHTKLYLRDGTVNFLYHDGVEGLTTSIEETVEFLRFFIRRMKPARTTMMGMSGGGFAAGLFSHLVGAAPDTRIDDVHVQSGVTYISLEARDRLGGGERFPGSFDAFVEHMKERGEDTRYSDLHPVVRDHPDSVKVMRMYYAEGDEIDSLHAKNLEEFPHIQTVPHQSASHVMLGSRLMREGTLYRDVDTDVETLMTETPGTASVEGYAPAAFGARMAMANRG